MGPIFFFQASGQSARPVGRAIPRAPGIRARRAHRSRCARAALGRAAWASVRSTLVSPNSAGAGFFGAAKRGALARCSLCFLPLRQDCCAAATSWGATRRSGKPRRCDSVICVLCEVRFARRAGRLPVCGCRLAALRAPSAAFGRLRDGPKGRPRKRRALGPPSRRPSTLDPVFVTLRLPGPGPSANVERQAIQRQAGRQTVKRPRRSAAGSGLFGGF